MWERVRSFHPLWVPLSPYLHLFTSSFRTLSSSWMTSTFWPLSFFDLLISKDLISLSLPYHPVVIISYPTSEISNLNPLFSQLICTTTLIANVLLFISPLWASLSTLTGLYATIHQYNITPLLSFTQTCLEKLQFWINHNIYLLFACTRAARCCWRNHSTRLTGFILKSWSHTSEWRSILLSNPIMCL